MAGATAASLTIVTGQDGRRVRLSVPNGDHLVVRLPEPDVVRAQYHRLAVNLERFRSGFADVPESRPEVAARQLDGLAKAGRNFLANVLTGTFEEVDRLVAFVRAACPTWCTGPGIDPVIHVVSPLEYHLPWELLPLFEWKIRPDAKSVAQLWEQARAFVGFGARVERRLSGRVVAEPVLDARDYLQVRVFHDAAYIGAQHEVEFLRGLAPRVRVEGPYPTGPADGDAPTVAQQLRDPTVGVDGVRRRKPDQVVHFGCHCETGAEGGWEDFLFQLRHDPEGPLQKLTLGELMDEMMLADTWEHPDRSRLMPLVFLNACATSDIDPKVAMSMLTPFAKNGNRGLIGTAARVPDRVAAKFSRWFYTELFRGRTVAEAIHLARRDLLVTYANPLGLLYTHYGDPELRALPVLDPVRS